MQPRIPCPNPNNIEIYDVVSIERVVDVDDSWWLEAVTACGHNISVICFEGERFGVVVSKEDRTVRQYSGGSGSDAERVFQDFHEAYYKLAYP